MVIVLHKWPGIVFVALFLLMQSFAVSHASAHGHHDHGHDGIQCEIEVIASEQDGVNPPSALADTVVTSPAETVFRKAYVSATYPGAGGRAPPPRGPPVSCI